MSVPVLAIVGCSNAGKTTLIEKLVGHFVEQGMRVGTIKHSHHQPEMDTPSKDSWRHKEAGASASLLVGPQKMLMVSDLSETPTPHQLSGRFFEGFDLVLVEGYSAIPGAKIEVMRAARSRSLRCNSDELIAVATDIEGLNLSVMCFDLDDVRTIAAHILDWMDEARR